MSFFKEGDLKNGSVALSDDGRSVVIIDQTKLPLHEEYLTLTTKEEFYDAIKVLAVRGAPAIGICAAYSMYILALPKQNMGYEEFAASMKEDGEYINSSRPTAVNLSWAIRRQFKVIDENAGKSGSRNHQTARTRKPLRSTRKTSRCAAGFKVFADETRPLLQGARLTSYELEKAGVDVTLICDNMASMVMKNGWVQACFVGCDRIAANGDFANKIGTSGVAILAKHYGIPFYAGTVLDDRYELPDRG